MKHIDECSYLMVHPTSLLGCMETYHFTLCFQGWLAATSDVSWCQGLGGAVQQAVSKSIGLTWHGGDDKPPAVAGKDGSRQPSIFES